MRLTTMLATDKTLRNQNRITKEIYKNDLFCHVVMLNFNYTFASDKL